jgi:hypothetical protein
VKLAFADNCPDGAEPALRDEFVDFYAAGGVLSAEEWMSMGSVGRRAAIAARRAVDAARLADAVDYGLGIVSTALREARMHATLREAADAAVADLNRGPIR